MLRSMRFITRVMFICGSFWLLLAACPPELQTAVTSTPLPATAMPTGMPLPTATTTIAPITNQPTSVPQITTPLIRDLEPPELVGLSTDVPLPTSTPDASFCPLSTADLVSTLPIPATVVRILFLNDDLWLWREESGTAVALTSGGAVTAYDPTPDYQTIAYLQAGDLWLWRSGQTAVRLTEAVEIADFTLTSDGQVIAYRRMVNDDEHELWAVRSDGSAPLLLAQPSAAATRNQYPDAVSIGLSIGWVQDSHILAYQFDATLPGGIGDPPPVPRFWVDADSGQPLDMPPPEPAPETHSGYRLEMAIAPENNQNVQLIDSSGHIALTLSSPYEYTWSFSPDDRYLIAAVMEGAVIVDLTDLSQQPIPVPLRSFGFGHGGAGLAPSWWLDNHTWLAVVPNEDEIHRPGDTFTLWRVDAAAGTAVPLANLPGSILSATLSPDQQFLAFGETTRSHVENLHLYNLATGQDQIYDSGSGVWVDHWLDESSIFIYSYRSRDGIQLCLLWGQSNQPPVPLALLAEGYPAWLDETRFLLTSIGSSLTYITGTIYFQSLLGELIYVGEVTGPAPDKRPFSEFRVYFEER